MNTRLKQFLTAENISQSQFADTIKVVRASVSHVLAGRNKPGYDFIKAIMTAYPHLNMEWLIMGKGKMYKQDSSPIQHENEMPLLFDYENTDDAQQLTPIYEVPPIANAQPDSPTIPMPRQPQTNTSYNKAQSIVNQRKAIKVAVFYDDGTYQEFKNI